MHARLPESRRRPRRGGPTRRHGAAHSDAVRQRVHGVRGARFVAGQYGAAVLVFARAS
ncbi:hypothetical protein [Streptomyces sp. SID12501]|uniref:Uncharacterized protein n=1 Tax=Streptomyces sp. SID12501 TaxID=2706042 RepID=A0A6B3BW21_9ACTN|nr:hypothetical protein [Streptomyces sp. SID12501]NEC88583.1 hypothetical protein [Streptomyces sp. SID12501]